VLERRGYMKMYIYLGIILLCEAICLRYKTFDMSYYKTYSVEHKIVFVFSFLIMKFATFVYSLVLYYVAPVTALS
jgi:uncharacterized membrane protein YidH (DUF202 family)